MTELESAKKSLLTPVMRRLAREERMPAKLFMQRMARGEIVVPLNRTHSLDTPCAIGKGLRTKVNANIGTSPDSAHLHTELRKLRNAVAYGADTVMDLSVGGPLGKIRRAITAESKVPVGTVPVYEVAVNAQQKKRNLLDFGIDEILKVLELQAKEKVDFFTIHCGVTRKSLEVLRKHKRILGIVSRGGAILASWMAHHKKENPFYEYFDRILDIASAYDVTLSLGDGLRPGSILDATDSAQVSELTILSQLALRAKKRHVQVMIEGPGHVPLDQIKENISLEKKICRGAPFYVLGPLVTDVACGYDHITAAIGGALAASYGADFLCYVTASEHLRHPSSQDVREGTIASRIAAHAADIVKEVVAAKAWDKAMSVARRKRDWKKQIALSIDPQKARELRRVSQPEVSDVCTMCGQYCSIKLMEKCVRV